MRKSFLFVALLSAVGCSTPFGEAPAPDGGASSADAGGDATPEQPAVVTQPPANDELNETYGVFVSFAGTPNGDGTRAKPLSSIQAGIEKATPPGKRVYVCKGTYKETLTLQSGISVIGGYDCTVGWVADQNGRSRIESPTSPAIRANNIAINTSFMGFDVVAPDASGTGSNASSIGLIAQNASSLTVANGSIIAGKGADGAPGTTPADAVIDAEMAKGGDGMVETYDTKSWNAGIVNSDWLGGKGGQSSCGADAGGNGGTSGVFLCDYFHNVWEYYLNQGYTYNPIPVGTPAEAGGAGLAGHDGVSATTIGTLTADGYVTADGTAGSDGNPGHGGRGGTAEATAVLVGVGQSCTVTTTLYNSGTGAGGGAGGCGGLAGTPGKGGGASIAALLSASEGLTFDAALVLAGQAGAGGKGSLGGSPTPGGAAGATAAGAGAAQPGGPGGLPGVSGSGAGGPSIGVAYTGGKPNLINGTIAKAGGFGAGVAGDSNTFQDVTWILPASDPGIAEDMHEF
ncbi:MAG: hypothetical protein FWD73_04295 [Polyangiaceae bacterium]|nr:hypothetical protein [Polyangiaceae bacterium]